MKTVLLSLIMTFFGSIALGQDSLPECLLSNPANPYEKSYLTKMESCVYGYSKTPHYYSFNEWGNEMCPAYSVSVYSIYLGVSCVPVNAISGSNLFLVFSYVNGAWKSPGYHSYNYYAWNAKGFSLVSCSSTFPGCDCLPVGTNSGFGVCTQPKGQLKTL